MRTANSSFQFKRNCVHTTISFILLSLKQIDEVPSRRNSQETVFYHIRRLTTPSAVSTALSEKHATQWRWYWQDSFGMWRNFPQNSADVIETSAACLSDDIEAKFLAGIFLFTVPSLIINIFTHFRWFTCAVLN